ncbi:MAG: VOC family protein [Acidobacteria bacterium]|jgi:predicted lactoylglutathione lyase|nr:VOC family protein [Acidobacteriota bacterium]
MEQRVSLITLGVTDVNRSRAFYESLGWSGAVQHEDEVCFFQVGSLVFGLWTQLGGHGAPGLELAYNVRTPEDVAEILDEVRRAGGTVIRESAVTDWGGTAGAFTDLDGYVWEVAHNPGWPLDANGVPHLPRTT